MRLITLHGFLGTPGDWDFLDRDFPQYTQHHLNLLDPGFFIPQDGICAAGKTVNQIARGISDDKILIGYSLGGRIAIHALIESPTLWKAAVIISAHTGLESERDREERYCRDCLWADKFQSDPWQQLISEWNAQPVFAGENRKRSESDFSRSFLVSVLKEWSLSKQDNLVSPLKELDMPVLWISGENDKKFTTIAKGVQLSHPISRHCIVKDAAHRVPWEQRERFKKELSDFLDQINKRRKDERSRNGNMAGDKKVSRY